MDHMGSDKVYPTDMPDDNQLFSADYRDGRLQIVEVAMFDKLGNSNPVKVAEPSHILPDTSSDSGGEQKYLQVLETSNGLVQLDLLNFTLVKGSDGNTYQMVSADSTTADNGDTTITCVLSSDDVEDGDNPEPYVMLQTDNDEEQDPYIYLQSAQQQKQPTTDNTQTEEAPAPLTSKVPDKPKALTPIQILEKAKAIQRAKALSSSSSTASKSRRGRKRKGDLPPPLELLSSPNFKLYLYSCKHCTFKCNATKEMTVHKKSCQKSAPPTKRPPPLQCARCPFKGHAHGQLMKHVRDTHYAKAAQPPKSLLDIQLDSEEVVAADVLVCGACGFESGDRPVFRAHIEIEHGARNATII